MRAEALAPAQPEHLSIRRHFAADRVQFERTTVRPERRFGPSHRLTIFKIERDRGNIDEMQLIQLRIFPGVRMPIKYGFHGVRGF